MNEFLNIYRLYAKNFDRDFVERAWDAEDIEKLKKLLDKICGEIENGHIIIGILKNDLDIWQDREMIYALQNVRDTIFEIESLLHSKDQGEKPDRLIKENVEERKKKEKELEPKRDEVGKWKKILEGEKPLKQYGTIGISPTIKDYIWDRLPTDFKYTDVIAFFKEFYEEKLGRRLKKSSYGTYASRYIKYFKEHDPLMISWDEYEYSKDIDKYETADKEPEGKEGKIAIPPKPGSTYMPWEIQILKKHRPFHTAEYIHENLLPHRTAKSIILKAGKLGIKKIREYKKKRKIKSETELWRTEEDDVIREYHPYMAVEEYIGRLPGRSIDEVTARASYLKVKGVTDTNIVRDEMLESGKQNRDVGLKADGTIETKLTKDKVGDGRRLTDETKKLLKEAQEKAKEQKKEEETKKLLKEKHEEAKETKKLLKEAQEKAKEQKKEEETKKLLKEAQEKAKETKRLLSEERIDEKEGGTIEPDLVKEHVGEKAEEIIKDELAKDDGLFDEKIEETIEKLEKEDKRIEQEPVKTKLNNPFYKGSAEHHLYQIAVEANWTAGFKKGTPKVMIMARMANFSKEEIKNAIDTLVKKRKAQRLPNNFIAFLE